MAIFQQSNCVRGFGSAFYKPVCSLSIASSSWWRENMEADSDDIPLHFTARRTEFHCCSRRSATKKNPWIKRSKSQQKGLYGRFVKAEKSEEQMVRFASIKKQHEDVEDGIRAISQCIGVILYGFRQSARPGAFTKRLSFTQRWVNLWKRTHAAYYFWIQW